MGRKKKENKRGLIISGGGAFGAYGVGTLAALDKEYDVVAGISTGALMAGLVSLRKWEVLKEAYTSVTDESIFDKKWYRPHVFNKEGKLNVMSVFYVLINRMFGRKTSLNTLATTNNMRKLIDKFLSEEDYNTIKNLNKEVVVAAVNINEFPPDVHYFSSCDETFEDFKDWTWASANAPFVTTLLEKKWFDEEDKKWYMGEWTDGGLNELAPFDYVLQKGIKEVDIIMHRAKPIKEKERKLTEDLLENVERSIAAMRYDIEFEDGKLLEDIARFAKDNGVKITVYWLPRKLAPNSLVFDKQTMLKWYEEGFNSVNDPKRIDIFE
jgi:predicted acylesterase/phospholipase RssA